MKITIGKKLNGSFLGLSLIVAVAGLAGLIMVNKVARSGDIVMEEKLPIKDVSMEAIIAAERALNACRNYLLSETNLDTIEEKIGKYISDFDMYISMVKYGTESEEFKSSPAGKMYATEGLDIKVSPGTEEMQALVEKISQHQLIFTNMAKELIENHKKRVQYSFIFDNVYYDLPAFFYSADIKHRRWFEQLQNAVEYEVDFTGETDPTKCFFGTWYSSYKCEDPELIALLDKFQSIHARFHEVGLKIMAADESQKESLLHRGTRYAIKVQQGLGKLEKYAEGKIKEIEAQEQTCVNTMFEESAKMTSFLGQLEEMLDHGMSSALENAKQVKTFSIWMLIF